MPPIPKKLSVNAKPLAVNPTQLGRWWQRTSEGLVALGVCDKPGEFSVVPIQIGAASYQTLEHDLPRVIELARRITRKMSPGPSWARDDQRELIAQYQDKPTSPIVARPDGIIVDGQLKLIELNVESGLGGCFEVDFVQARFASLLHDMGAGGLSAPLASDGLVHLLKQLCSSIDCDVCDIGILVYRHFKIFPMKMAHQLVRLLRDSVPNVVGHIVYPEDIYPNGDWMSDGTRQFQMLWRFGSMAHPREDVVEMIAVQRRAASTRTLVMSHPADMAVEGKLVLAALSQAGGGESIVSLTAEESNLVERYVPWTRILKKSDVTYRGSPADLCSLLRKEKDRFVLKRAHSKSTQHVFIGAEQSAAAWNDTINVALDDVELWVVQDNLKSSPAEFSYFNERGVQYNALENYTYNQFVFGDRCAAPLIRIERDPKNRKVAMSFTSAMAITGTVVNAALPHS